MDDSAVGSENSSTPVPASGGTEIGTISVWVSSSVTYSS